MNSPRTEKPRHLGRGLESLLGPISEPEIGLPSPPATTAGLEKMPPDEDLEKALMDLKVEDV
jgi:hypothetical protein